MALRHTVGLTEGLSGLRGLDSSSSLCSSHCTTERSSSSHPHHTSLVASGVHTAWLGAQFPPILTPPHPLCTLQKPDTVTEHVARPLFLKSKNSRAGDISQWLESLPHVQDQELHPQDDISHMW